MQKYKYRPRFVSGPESCVLKSFSLTRNRLLAGNTFFRSREIGRHVVTVQCVWLTNMLVGGIPSGPEDVTVDQLSVNSVKLIVDGFDSSGQAHTNVYYAEQTILPATEGTWASAIPALRTAVNNNDPIVTMPETDFQAPFAAGSDDGEYVNYFGQERLMGGDGAPTNEKAISTLRTGPEKSIIYLLRSENKAEGNEHNDNGTLLEVNELREWNGYAWIKYTSV